MANELYHYGIKSMKWGVRRFQRKDGTRTQAGKKRRKDDWSEDAKAASEIKKKSVSQMSNAELRKLNERQQLENQHRQLNPNALKRGKKAIVATAATMGTVMTLVNNSDKMISLGKSAGNKVVEKVGGMVIDDLKRSGW